MKSFWSSSAAVTLALLAIVASASAQDISGNPGEIPVSYTPASALMPAPVQQPPEIPLRTKAEQPAVYRGIMNKMPGWSSKLQKEFFYEPVSAIAVLPIYVPDNNRAYSDVPVILAKELATDLEAQVAPTVVLNPGQLMQDIQARGLESVYRGMVSDYLSGGRPDPQRLGFLLKQLSENGPHIDRVILVEGMVDFNRMAEPTGVLDRARSLLTDGKPSRHSYLLQSRIQAFDTKKTDCPRVWSLNWSKPVKADKTGFVTPSVYQNMASLQTFSKTSREISREIRFLMPLSVYSDMHAVTKQSVQGQLVAPGEKTSPLQTLDESVPK